MPCDQLVRILEDRLDLEDEPVVGLVGRVLPQALRLDRPSACSRPAVNVSTVTIGVPKSCDVEPALEVARQRRLDEVDDQRLALLADVDAGRRCRTGRRRSGLRRCAPRRKSTSRSACWTSPGRASAKRCTVCALASSWSLWSIQRHQHRVALDLRLERLRLVEVEHDARAVAGLDHVEAAQRGVVDRAAASRRGRCRCRGSRARSAAGSRSRSRRADWRAAFFSTNLTIVLPGRCPSRRSSSRCCWSPARSAAPAREERQQRPRATRARRGPFAPGSRRCRCQTNALIFFAPVSSCRPGSAAACWSARSSRRRRPARAPSGGSRCR